MTKPRFIYRGEGINKVLRYLHAAVRSTHIFFKIYAADDVEGGVETGGAETQVASDFFPDGS
jgi:hypothetical protein